MGMRLLKLLQLAQQLVVLRIRSDRRIEDVVTVVVVVDFGAQFFDALFNFGEVRHEGDFITGAGRHRLTRLSGKNESRSYYSPLPLRERARERGVFESPPAILEKL